jgi:hypothetical protein
MDCGHDHAGISVAAEFHFRAPEISVPIAARNRGPLKINPTAVARIRVGKSSGSQADIQVNCPEASSSAMMIDLY